MLPRESSSYVELSSKDKPTDYAARALWWFMLLTRLILPAYMIWAFYSAFG